MNTEVTTTAGFIEQYDYNILSEAMKAMYGHSGFYNVGEWTANPASLQDACRAHVVNHLNHVEAGLNPKKILDAGCGLGTGTGVMAQHFPEAQVVGINISEKQVAFAQQSYPDIAFRVMDATCMALPDGQLDLIVSVEAAFHFNTRIDFLNEAYRVLRPGGQVIFSDMLLRNTDWVGSWSVPAGNLVKDVAAYKALCTAAGFELLLCSDITGSTIKGFCNHLRNTEHMAVLADGLEDSVIAYLLTGLRKPQP